MKTVLSGIQPTGNVHLGNYLGSIRNWIELQDQYNSMFGIMNLHAITASQDQKELKQNVLDVAAIYLACGLDPEKSTIFIQSDISQISDISWVFSCLTPMGWLNRMTQFKEKSSAVFESTKKDSDKNDISNSEKANLGLYAYPVLMASDILTFHADLVPVGQDQKQHLELCRDIAGAFNRKVKTDYFKLPEPLIFENVKRIMSLQDGLKKMSKSDEIENSRINLTDSSDVITKKIKRAKTDSETEINYDQNRPEIYNLLNIFSAFSKDDPKIIAQKYQNSGYGAFKKDLAEIIVENLADIQYNIDLLRKDYGFIEKILQQGAIKAQEIANKTKKEVFSLMGL